MYTDKKLLSFLPSKHKNILAKIINKKLIEIVRFFEEDLENFLIHEKLPAVNFFSLNVGLTKLVFESDLSYNFSIYGEQLSIILLPEQDLEEEFYSDGQWYQLSQAKCLSTSDLRNCLEQTCIDVRIWTLKEDFESGEAKEVAVSYLLANGSEIFYCIYLHEDLDADYLLLKPDVDLTKAASCFSLLLGEYIKPK
ncbi:hypothetical protein IQ255_06425 [Pleurocapsales cyanobacterium LEGE 10410]|nr:hypothetical protein [Pleurocapsales cyanobacterium LEGE 10410]